MVSNCYCYCEDQKETYLVREIFPVREETKLPSAYCRLTRQDTNATTTNIPHLLGRTAGELVPTVPTSPLPMLLTPHA